MSPTATNFMTIDDFKRKHPGGRTYTTGKRSIVPDGPLIDSTDPRWEKAGYEEIMYVTDRDSTFAIPPEWTHTSGPIPPDNSYKGKVAWKDSFFSHNES